MTIDLWKIFVWTPALILFMLGVIPFTPVAVGLLLIAGECSFTLSWSR